MFPQDVHIEGRQVEILPEWREKIEAELAHLAGQAHDPILHARVELIGTGHHRRGAFEIHLVVSVAGHTLTVRHQGEHVMPLIVEAFKALNRQVREHARIIQQKVKVHEESRQYGKIARLFPEEDFGFIETLEGLEVYFHANAVKKGSFKALREGMKVEFSQERGESGPQAAWVRPVE